MSPIDPVQNDPVFKPQGLEKKEPIFYPPGQDLPEPGKVNFIRATDVDFSNIYLGVSASSNAPFLQCIFEGLNNEKK
jgi:hypothetical protein